MSILAARGLSARTADSVLLDDIHLDVAAGEVTAVIGESGSGKTTLGLALLGEHQNGLVLSGSARIRHVELLGLTGPQRRRQRSGSIGHLPQHPAAVLNPARRVGTVLMELAALRHSGRVARRTAVEQALRSAQLPPDRQLLRRYPHQLSGGQRQRVALAHVLITQPAAVVLDEPTTGLDLATRAETVRVLTELSAAGTAVVLLTHDLRLARKLANEVLVLHDGHIVEHGPGTRPLYTPAHAHSRALLAAESRCQRDSNDVSHASNNQPPALRVTNLAKATRSGTPILANIDMTVPAGRCVAITGASGSGKTTLARCLAGLTAPDTGRMLLDERPLPANISQRSRAQRRAVQYVHQDARASFDEHRPVREQVARSACLLLGSDTTQARRRADETFSLLGVDPAHAHRRPRELSGGQLQRAALVRALLAQPDVLICDEITAALDTATQAELLELLTRTVTTAGTSLVMISHESHVLATVAARVHVLDAGHWADTVST